MLPRLRRLLASSAGWWRRLSLLRFGQTEAQNIAVDLACAVVVDFLMHRDEDWRLRDVKLALDRLKAGADNEQTKPALRRAN